MPIAKGTEVKQKIQVIEGTVSKVTYDDESSEFKYLVDFKSDSEDHQRWFSESEIEVK